MTGEDKTERVRGEEGTLFGRGGWVGLGSPGAVVEHDNDEATVRRAPRVWGASDVSPDAYDPPCCFPPS